VAYPTLLDIAIRNNTDAEVGLIDEAAKGHPEVMFGAAKPIRGINYKARVRTALGNVAGSFRNANEGSTPHVHTYETRLFECFILAPMFIVDRAVADADDLGAAGYLAEEAAATLEGEFQALGKQFYYGRSVTGYGTGAVGSAKGPPGLFDVYDATNMKVDATGSSAGTGSSVWLVRFGVQAVRWIVGLDGQLEFSPIRIETTVDPAAATKFFEAYVQSMTARIGLQVGSLQDVCRIADCTADSTKGLTDALISQALAKFPAGRGPNAIFMSLRSLAQLQASRTATTPTGQPAPFPDAITGIAQERITIYATDSISNTETLDV